MQLLPREQIWQSCQYEQHLTSYHDVTVRWVQTVVTSTIEQIEREKVVGALAPKHSDQIKVGSGSPSLRHHGISSTQSYVRNLLENECRSPARKCHKR
jgi:hypothetical protein